MVQEEYHKWTFLKDPFVTTVIVVREGLCKTRRTLCCHLQRRLQKVRTLFAVAGRFGLWDRTVDPKHFASFLEYAGEVLSFIPKAAIPYLAWAATVCETSLGILLIQGLWPRWVSLGSAILLAMFGTAMAISFGLKSPANYSVYSVSGATVLLALYTSRQNSKMGPQ
jgi:uncharacterized membrane protein YphA (DoxX/SURF4 family)